MTSEPRSTHRFPRWLLVTAIIVVALVALGITFAVGRATGNPAPSKPQPVAAFAATTHLRLHPPGRPTGTSSGGITATANNAGDQLQSEQAVSTLAGAGDDSCAPLLYVAPVGPKDLLSDDPLQGLPGYQLTTADAARGNYGAVARQYASISAAAKAQANDVKLLPACSDIPEQENDVYPVPVKALVPGAAAIAWSYHPAQDLTSTGTTTVRVTDLRVANRLIRATCTMSPATQRAKKACASWLTKLVAVERES